MRTHSPTFWKLFNTGARFVGLCFAVVGLLFAVWGVSISMNSGPRHDSGEWLLILVVGVGVGLFGVLMLRSRPYRPDAVEKTRNDQKGQS